MSELKSQLLSFGASQFKKYMGGVLSNVSGGRISGGSAPTLTNYGSKHSTENLEFPLNVSANGAGIGNHGHYIMFYINAQEKSKLRTSKEGSGGSIVDSDREYNIPKYITEWDSVTESYKKVDSSNVLATGINNNHAGLSSKDREAFIKGNQGVKEIAASESKARGSTIFQKRAPTKRLKTAIAMYMPASVAVTYGANYTDTSMGAATPAALDAYEEFFGSNYKGAAESVLSMSDRASEGMRNAMLNMIGVLPGFGGTREAFEMREGEIITDRLELAFKGINKRNFQYTFKMIPKSQREAEEIRKIVFAFKANMLPEFKGGDRSGRRLIVPNTFDIEYMYNGSTNQYLHHVSTCVLENMSITYGGERYKTFEATADGAPPVETSITLAFKEMELITKERVFEGY